MANPFAPLKNKPKAFVTDYHTDEDKYIIEYEEIDVVKKIGEKETEFVIEKKVVESSRVDRQGYIDSFAEEVGIMNIIEKVRKTGDVTLLDQTKRSPVPSEKTGRGNLEEIVDISGIPNSFIEADAAIMKGHNLFADLPEDLKGKISFEDFVAKAPELYAKYIESQVAKNTKTEVKGDNDNGK